MSNDHAYSHNDILLYGLEFAATHTPWSIIIANLANICTGTSTVLVDVIPDDTSKEGTISTIMLITNDINYYHHSYLYLAPRYINFDAG